MKKGDARQYNVGDKIWLEATNITMDRPIRKFDDKRHGPFIIFERKGKSS
jgi:hypothetical protein